MKNKYESYSCAKCHQAQFVTHEKIDKAIDYVNRILRHAKRRIIMSEEREERKVGLSSPWITYYREVRALFGDDPDIKIEYNADENIIKMMVQGQEKADAITELLPPEKEFGNVVLKIAVIPANKLSTPRADTFQKAFEGNPALSFVTSVQAFGGNFDYVVFKNKVVQFYNDDIGDYYGNKSTLYEDIARDVFGDVAGVSFCTDIPKE